MLTHEERTGLEEIREGIRTKNWMIYTTDKSGKVVLDTKENFLSCLEEHLKMDKRVTLVEVREAEKLLNDHSRA